MAKGLLQLVAIIKQSNELLDPPCFTVRACDFIVEGGEERVTSYPCHGESRISCVSSTFSQVVASVWVKA